MSNQVIYFLLFFFFKLLWKWVSEMRDSLALDRKEERQVRSTVMSMEEEQWQSDLAQ